MKGLEATEIKLSEVKNDNYSFRIDSEFFIKDFINIHQILANKKHFNFGSNDILLSIINGDDIREYVDEGIPYIRTGDFLDYGIDINKAVKVNNIQNVKVRLDYGDLLVTRKGSYGRVDVVKNSDLENVFISSEVFRIKLKNINSFYVSVFLKTKYGQIMFERHIHGISNFSITQEAMLSFIIPLFSVAFQNHIELIVNENEKKINQSASIYSSAEKLLLSHLGLDNFTPSDCGVAIKSFSSSFGESGRLDSEYYQPKYEEIEDKIMKFKNGYSLISDNFSLNENFYKKINEYHNYIEISDVDNSNGIASFNIVPTEELPANAKIKLEKGNIIYSKVRPYRGAVAICDFDEEIVASGAFTVLKESNRMLKECLFVLLRSVPYKELIMKFNVGSSYPVVKDEDVLALPIPIIDLDFQKKIADQVKQSFALRKEAKELLELAKTAVETAIEHGEDKAMALLKDLKL